MPYRTLAMMAEARRGEIREDANLFLDGLVPASARWQPD